MDIDTLDYQYLPQGKKEIKLFAYNEQVKDQNSKLEKISKFIPENTHQLDFNKKVINKCIQKYQIPNFNMEFL